MIRIGLNTTLQNTAALVPKNVLIEDIEISGVRDKRAIEVNFAKGVIRNCKITDVYHPNKQDSQAIWVGNTIGDLEISDNHLQAASENILIGGDTMKIPNTRPTNIRILRNLLDKKMEWKDDPAIPVKNLLECKDGHSVWIEDLVARNCWQSGQGGYCFMFTPANGASLRDINVVRANVSNVAGIVNITGNDATGVNKVRTQVRFDGGIYTTNKAEMGGRGDFALITRGPEYLDVFNCNIEIDGTTFIYVGDDKQIERIQVENCRFNAGKYGINIAGRMNGDNSLGIVKSLIIRNNTILGASSKFKDNFPDNTYI